MVPKILSPLTGLILRRNPIPHADAWGYDLSPLRGTNRRLWRD